MHKEPQEPWSVTRQNLIKLFKQYPNAYEDVIDAAYLTGLDVLNDRIATVEKQTVSDIREIISVALEEHKKIMIEDDLNPIWNQRQQGYKEALEHMLDRLATSNKLKE